MRVPFEHEIMTNDSSDSFVAFRLLVLHNDFKFWANFKNEVSPVRDKFGRVLDDSFVMPSDFKAMWENGSKRFSMGSFSSELQITYSIPKIFNKPGETPVWGKLSVIARDNYFADFYYTDHPERFDLYIVTQILAYHYSCRARDIRDLLLGQYNEAKEQIKQQKPGNLARVR